jgi:hypothetical protein
MRLILLRSSSLLLLAGLGFAGCSGDDAVVSETASSTGDTSTSTSTTSTSTDPTTSTSGETTSATTTTTTDPTTTTTSVTSDPTTTTTTDPTTTTDGTTTDGTTTDGTTTDGTTTDGTTTDGTTTDGTTTDGTTGGVEEDTIYDIQGEFLPLNTQVNVLGVIVTAKATEGLFLQEPDGGEYSGVWVYVGDKGPDISGLELGDEVDLVGITGDFEGLTEVDASLGEVTATGNKGLLPAPELVDLAVLGSPETAEPWEGVLVRIEGEPLGVEDEPGFDEFAVGDMVDQLLIDKLIYNVYDNGADFPLFGVGASFTAITGPLHYAFGDFKIEPRMVGDLEGYMAPQFEVIGIDEVQPGGLIVTEIMWDPSCANDDCEWIEVHNLGDKAVNLDGLVIQDENENPNQQGEILGEVLLTPGGYAWLGRKTPNEWPYAKPADAHYGDNPPFNNSGDDQVVLRNGNGILDSTAKYLALPGDTGISFHLKPDQLDGTANDDINNWCFSTVLFDNPNNIDEFGSPGSSNEAECQEL